MQFLDFCRAHGISIDREPPIGIWKRYPTEDHPSKRNGAVKFMGDHAFIQNHATETEISLWQAEGDTAIDLERIRRIAKDASRDIQDKQMKAAQKAAFILNQCQIGFHPYLEKKGFKEEQGNIWKHENELLLAIPMRIGQRLVGCQIIHEDGTKKFLFGQATSMAEFVFDNHGPDILCEGYATALSVKAAMKALKRRYKLHVCFSAGNMKKVAATLQGGFVVADHDKLNPMTGTRAGHEVAKAIGWPTWMPEDELMDANDVHQRDGLFKFSQSLGKVIK